MDIEKFILLYRIPPPPSTMPHVCSATSIPSTILLENEADETLLPCPLTDDFQDELDNDNSFLDLPPPPDMFLSASGTEEVFSKSSPMKNILEEDYCKSKFNFNTCYAEFEYSDTVTAIFSTKVEINEAFSLEDLPPPDEFGFEDDIFVTGRTLNIDFVNDRHLETDTRSNANLQQNVETLSENDIIRGQSLKQEHEVVTEGLVVMDTQRNSSSREQRSQSINEHYAMFELPTEYQNDHKHQNLPDNVNMPILASKDCNGSTESDSVEQEEISMVRNDADSKNGIPRKESSEYVLTKSSKEIARHFEILSNSRTLSPNTVQSAVHSAEPTAALQSTNNASNTKDILNTTNCNSTKNETNGQSQRNVEKTSVTVIYEDTNAIKGQNKTHEIIAKLEAAESGNKNMRSRPKTAPPAPPRMASSITRSSSSSSSSSTSSLSSPPSVSLLFNKTRRAIQDLNNPNISAPCSTENKSTPSVPISSNLTRKAMRDSYNSNTAITSSTESGITPPAAFSFNETQRMINDLYNPNTSASCSTENQLTTSFSSNETKRVIQDSNNPSTSACSTDNKSTVSDQVKLTLIQQMQSAIAKRAGQGGLTCWTEPTESTGILSLTSSEGQIISTTNKTQSLNMASQINVESQLKGNAVNDRAEVNNLSNSSKSELYYNPKSKSNDVTLTEQNREHEKVHPEIQDSDSRKTFDFTKYLHHHSVSAIQDNEDSNGDNNLLQDNLPKIWDSNIPHKSSNIQTSVIRSSSLRQAKPTAQIRPSAIRSLSGSSTLHRGSTSSLLAQYSKLGNMSNQFSQSMLCLQKDRLPTVVSNESATNQMSDSNDPFSALGSFSYGTLRPANRRKSSNSNSNSNASSSKFDTLRARLKDYLAAATASTVTSKQPQKHQQSQKRELSQFQKQLERQQQEMMSSYKQLFQEPEEANISKQKESESKQEDIQQNWTEFFDPLQFNPTGFRTLQFRKKNRNSSPRIPNFGFNRQQPQPTEQPDWLPNQNDYSPDASDISIDSKPDDVTAPSAMSMMSDTFNAYLQVAGPRPYGQQNCGTAAWSSRGYKSSTVRARGTFATFVGHRESHIDRHSNDSDRELKGSGSDTTGEIMKRTPSVNGRVAETVPIRVAAINSVGDILHRRDRKKKSSGEIRSRSLSNHFVKSFEEAKSEDPLNEKVRETEVFIDSVKASFTRKQPALNTFRSADTSRSCLDISKQQKSLARVSPLPAISTTPTGDKTRTETESIGNMICDEIVAKRYQNGFYDKHSAFKNKTNSHTNNKSYGDVSNGSQTLPRSFLKNSEKMNLKNSDQVSKQQIESCIPSENAVYEIVEGRVKSFQQLLQNVFIDDQQYPSYGTNSTFSLPRHVGRPKADSSKLFTISSKEGMQNGSNGDGTLKSKSPNSSPEIGAEFSNLVRRFVSDSQRLVSNATKSREQLATSVCDSVQNLAILVNTARQVVLDIGRSSHAIILNNRVRDLVAAYGSTVTAARQAVGREFSSMEMKRLMKHATSLAAVLSSLIKLLNRYEIGQKQSAGHAIRV